MRRPRRRSPSDPLPERPEQRSTLRRTAPTAPRRRSAGVGGPGGAQTSAVAGHTEGRQTARTGGGSGARTSAVEGRQTARTGGRSGARTSAIDGPADSAHRGRVRSADLRRRRPGGQRAPGAGQERPPPPSTARRTADLRGGGPHRGQADARTGGGSGARTSAVDGPVERSETPQRRIRSATPPHGCMYPQPSTTSIARRVRPDATGSLQPLGGEPEQLCCEGEGASERPPGNRPGQAGAPHRAGRTRPGLCGP